MSKAKEELPEPVCVAMVRDVTKVYRLGGQDVKALATSRTIATRTGSDTSSFVLLMTK